MFRRVPWNSRSLYSKLESNPRKNGYFSITASKRTKKKMPSTFISRDEIPTRAVLVREFSQRCQKESPIPFRVRTLPLCSLWPWFHARPVKTPANASFFIRFTIAARLLFFVIGLAERRPHRWPWSHAASGARHRFVLRGNTVDLPG